MLGVHEDLGLDNLAINVEFHQIYVLAIESFTCSQSVKQFLLCKGTKLAGIQHLPSLFDETQRVLTAAQGCSPPPITLTISILSSPSTSAMLCILSLNSRKAFLPLERLPSLKSWPKIYTEKSKSVHSRKFHYSDND